MMLMISAARILHSTSVIIFCLFRDNYCFVVRYILSLYSFSVSTRFFRLCWSLWIICCNFFSAYSTSKRSIFKMKGTILFKLSMDTQKPKFRLDFKISRKVLTLIRLLLSSGSRSKESDYVSMVAAMLWLDFLSTSLNDLLLIFWRLLITIRITALSSSSIGTLEVGILMSPRISHSLTFVILLSY